MKPGYSELEIRLGMDAAASSFFHLANRRYMIEGKEVEGLEMIDYYKALVDTYPIVLIEDLDDEDHLK
jgi:enolase